MATEKGWFIRSKEPNLLFHTLRPDIEGSWTTDVDKALLFVRKADAFDYFKATFHPSVQPQYEVSGIH